MKIYKLSLFNFKGIENLTLVLDGQNASIYGDNGTGKTTLYDAFLWLLFGKDSQGRKDTDIKPLGPDGNPAAGHVKVSADLEHDGHVYTLTRAYTEKRKTGRDGADVLVGHETSYTIDGVDMSQTQYNMMIHSLIPEDVFRMITHPFAFPTVNWKERRKVLCHMIASVNVDTVCAANPELSEIPELLKDTTPDAYGKVLLARIRKLDEALKQLPARLDEARNALPEAYAGEDPNQVLPRLREEEDMLRARLAPDDTAMGTEIREWQAKIQEAQNLLHDRKRKQMDTWERERPSALQDLRRELDAVEVPDNEYRKAVSNRDDLEKQLENLRSQWDAVNKEVFSDNAVCRACNRPFDAHDMEEKKNAFGLSKSYRLTSLTNEAKIIKDKLREAKNREAEVRERVVMAEAQREELQARMRERMDASFTPEGDAGLCASIAEMETRLDALLRDRKAAAENVKERNREILYQLDEVERETQKQYRILAAAESRKKGLARLEELEQARKDTAAKYSEAERQQRLLSMYNDARAVAMQEEADRLFAPVSFRLFDRKINGTDTECCDPMINGIPFESLNRATQINAGLMVIQVLSRYYGADAPVFVDNAEAVTELVDMPCQVIRLVVRPGDSQLHMERQDGMRATLSGSALHHGRRQKA